MKMRAANSAGGVLDAILMVAVPGPTAKGTVVFSLGLQRLSFYTGSAVPVSWHSSSQRLQVVQNCMSGGGGRQTMLKTGERAQRTLNSGFDFRQGRSACEKGAKQDLRVMATGVRPPASWRPSGMVKSYCR